MTTGQAVAALAEHSVPAGPVLTRAQVFDDPQVIHNNLIVEWDLPNGETLLQAGPPEPSRRPNPNSARSSESSGSTPSRSWPNWVTTPPRSRVSGGRGRSLNALSHDLYRWQHDALMAWHRWAAAG